MMNKGKKPALHLARHLVLVPLFATLAFMACHQKIDAPLPSTETESVEGMVEGVDIPDVVVEEEVIPVRIIEE